MKDQPLSKDEGFLFAMAEQCFYKEEEDERAYQKAEQRVEI